ncbi:MAG: MotA/TolQ/ExbB proton channel family protein, partial [Candidatus Latescibacterota bacterium]
MELLHSSFDYLEQGGWIMIPLCIVSVIMWILIFERLYTFMTMQREDITSELALQVIDGEELDLYSRGIKTQLVKSFVEERTGIPKVDRDILRQITVDLRRSMEKYLPAIAVLASIAPILGLLGTVLGMMETFNVISLFGTGNAKAMAGGISVALVTTQTGLLVAIPGLFLS